MLEYLFIVFLRSDKTDITYKKFRGFKKLGSLGFSLFYFLGGGGG